MYFLFGLLTSFESSFSISSNLGGGMSGSFSGQSVLGFLRLIKFSNVAVHSVLFVSSPYKLRIFLMVEVIEVRSH